VQPRSMPAPPKRAVRESLTQSSIAGFTSSSMGVRGFGSPSNHEVFQGLISQLFTTRSLPFDLIEDEAFGSLLTYRQPLLIDCIPSRRSFRRYIEMTYNQALTTVESQLHQVTTKSNLSFDLWTSPR
jgi:hypothetical protein